MFRIAFLNVLLCAAGRANDRGALYQKPEAVLMLQKHAHVSSDSDPSPAKRRKPSADDDEFISDRTWDSLVAGRDLHLMLRVRASKLFFCLVPKNACTEFLALLMRMNGMAERHWNPTRYGKEQERVHHDVDRSRMFLDRKEPDSYRRLMAAKNNGWVKAVFLRDPVARLLSAYYSKVALGKLEGKGYPHTLSFADFVARIEAEGLNVDTNEHWRPQSYTCNLNETIQKYDIVGSFDKLDEDAHRMVDLVGGPELARSMLDDGWGPYGNQSLFGVPRLVREEGCAGCAMPVTHGGSDVVESFSEIRVGEHAERQGDAAAQNVHSSRVASEAAFVRLMQRKLSFNPELTSRIKRLYAMDYALLDRANDPIRP